MSDKMTALVKKFQDQEKYPRMIGSEGGMDYLVVARKPEMNLQLGIKPIYGQVSKGHETGIFFGFRLRSSSIPGSVPGAKVHAIAGVEGDEDEGPKVEQADPQDGWAFDWENLPDSDNPNSHRRFRASLIRAVVLNRGEHDAEMIEQDLDEIRFYGKIESLLRTQVGDEEWMHTPEEVLDYVRASFYAPIKVLQAGNDPVAALELLEHSWQLTDKQHEAAKEVYEAKKAELLKAIEAKNSAEPQSYVPKPHFQEDLADMNSVAVNMLQGAKPKLSVVDTDDDEEDLPAPSPEQVAGDDKPAPSPEPLGEEEENTAGQKDDGPAAA